MLSADAKKSGMSPAVGVLPATQGCSLAIRGPSPAKWVTVAARAGVALATGPRLRLLPHVHGCDGFFAAVLERTG